MEDLFKKLEVASLGPSLEATVADAAAIKPLKDPSNSSSAPRHSTQRH
ncbi:hypothetical protein [Bradyrhizobium sp. LHD-71]|nr:hypothetical protein [Bradyrhizobium sp. LHD-71]MDQ8732398.1 hypothetical protein [Bradyrhizobium sp. LHD-71]